MLSSPFKWGGARVFAGGGVMSRRTAANDPSVADYRATSPFEWGGIAKGEE